MTNKSNGSGGLSRTLLEVKEILTRDFLNVQDSVTKKNTAIAASAKKAAAGEKALASGLRSAGSAAKRALADFDELERLVFSRSSGKTAKTADTDPTAAVDDALKKAVRNTAEEMDAAEYVEAWLNEYIWTPIEKFLEWIWSGITRVYDTFHLVLQAAYSWVIDALHSISDAILNFFADIGWNAEQCWTWLCTVWENTAAWVWENILAPLADLCTQGWNALSEAITNGWEQFCGVWGQAVSWCETNIIAPLTGLLENLKNAAVRGAVQAWDDLCGVWNGASDWFRNNVADRIGQVFSSAWQSILNGASDTWNGIRSLFGTAADFFGAVFSDAWERVCGVFSRSGEIFTDIRDGVLSGFRETVNGLIRGINDVVAVPFNGINDALSRLRNMTILDMKPFSGIGSVNVPRIPYLAQGAVLPANKPFMAVVGDQKHGTNVEAPLATIQEAVAQVMRQQQDAMMAGFGVTAENQEKLLSAVRSIRIGDQVIGRAAENYDRCRLRMVGEPW